MRPQNCEIIRDEMINLPCYQPKSTISTYHHLPTLKNRVDSGISSHETPLHSAAERGHLDVRLIRER